MSAPVGCSFSMLACNCRHSHHCSIRAVSSDTSTACTALLPARQCMPLAAASAASAAHLGPANAAQRLSHQGALAETLRAPQGSCRGAPIAPTAPATAQRKRRLLVMRVRAAGTEMMASCSGKRQGSTSHSQVGHITHAQQDCSCPDAAARCDNSTKNTARSCMQRPYYMCCVPGW